MKINKSAFIFGASTISLALLFSLNLQKTLTTQEKQIITKPSDTESNDTVSQSNPTPNLPSTNIADEVPVVPKNTENTHSAPLAESEEDTFQIQALAKEIPTLPPEQRAQTIDDLGFGDNAAAEPLIIDTLAHDPSPEVRAAAAAALETHGDSLPAIKALRASLSDSSSDVRENALISLTAIRNTAVQTELTDALKSGRLQTETAAEVRLFLNQNYPQKDPFADFTRH